MKLPFVSRKRYENERGRIVVFEPTGQLEVEPWHFSDGRLCYHDRQVGWVERKEFKTYEDYNEYVKSKPTQRPPKKER